MFDSPGKMIKNYHYKTGGATQAESISIKIILNQMENRHTLIWPLLMKLLRTSPSQTCLVKVVLAPFTR